MDEKRSHAIEKDRPISKPEYPLPALFTRMKRSELPTRCGQEENRSSKVELAHFYRKQTSESGSPVYGFYITRDPAKARKD